jgi:hypothetical protein
MTRKPALIMILPVLALVSMLFSSCTAPASQPAPEVTATAPLAATPSPQPPTQTAEPASPTLIPTATTQPGPAPTATPALAPRDAFMKGMILAGHWRGEFDEPTSDWILQHEVLPLGPTWIRINVIGCRQKDLKSTNISCDYEFSQPDRELIHVIQLAHQLGLRVMLDLSTGLEQEGTIWHGMIGRGYTETAWAAWFNSYTQAAVRYAELSEENQVDAYNFASELESTVAREKQWRAVIAAIRDVYHGPLIFSLGDEASWERVQFWDAVDFIGLHPYNFAITHTYNSSLADMDAAWKPIAARLEALSHKWHRPIVFTEIGYPSLDGIGMDMNNNGKLWNVDLQESADLYQSVIDTFGTKDWFAGLFPLGIYAYGNPVEPENILFTIDHKPAAEVIRKFYGAEPLPPQPADPPVPNEFKNVMVIYDDTFQHFWFNTGNMDPGIINLRQTQVALSGSAIQARLRPFEELVFQHTALYPEDLAPYQWIEFYIYIPVGSPKPLPLEICFRNGGFYRMPNYVMLPSARYLEGGQQVQGKWQRVLIPLQSLGPIVTPVSSFTINLSARGPATIYIDQVRLLGN